MKSVPHGKHIQQYAVDKIKIEVDLVSNICNTSLKEQQNYREPVGGGSRTDVRRRRGRRAAGSASPYAEPAAAAPSPGTHVPARESRQAGPAPTPAPGSTPTD